MTRASTSGFVTLLMSASLRKRPNSAAHRNDAMCHNLTSTHVILMRLYGAFIRSAVLPRVKAVALATRASRRSRNDAATAPVPVATSTLRFG
jgi:hypothetical protein